MNGKIRKETIEKLKEVVSELNVASGNPSIEREVANAELAVRGALEQVSKGIAVVGAARALLDIVQRPERIRPVRGHVSKPRTIFSRGKRTRNHPVIDRSD